MRRITVVPLALTLLAATASVFAQSPLAAPALQTAIITATGPKQGSTGTRYFNVEGKSTGKYADFGVVRFDISKIKSDLAKQLGKGKVTDVTLSLAQSNAAFTKDGTVDFYFTPDDTTDVTSASSPLKYPYDPKGKLLTGNGSPVANSPSKAAPPARPKGTQQTKAQRKLPPRPKRVRTQSSCWPEALDRKI